MLASKVSTQSNVLEPNEGAIGNDVTNEKEEAIVDKEMDELEEEYDPGSNSKPRWPGSNPEFHRNWTEWYMERIRLNMTTNQSVDRPHFDHESFENFLKNWTKDGFNQPGWMHPPFGNPGNIDTPSNVPLKNVSLSDGIQYDVMSSIWHDENYFTQGLTYSRGSLYESVGLYGESKVCRLNPNNGTSQKCVDIPTQFFAEGIQVYGKGYERLIQLTWKEGIGWIRDATTLDILSEFKFTTTRNEVC